MPKRDGQVQNGYAHQRHVQGLHKDLGTFPMAFCPQTLGHHGSGVTDGPRKEHGERQLHRASSQGRVHLGRTQLGEEQAVDKGHEGVKRHGQEHGECHHQHILHVAIFLEF